MDDRQFDGFTLVDRARSACLCEVGLAGYVIALCVTADGDDTPWLVSEAELLTGTAAAYGDANQPHEQLGTMPARWRYKVALAPLRCGRPRADGRPCRQIVGAPGRPCARHPERTSAP